LPRRKDSDWFTQAIGILVILHQNESLLHKKTSLAESIGFGMGAYRSQLAGSGE